MEKNYNNMEELEALYSKSLRTIEQMEANGNRKIKNLKRDFEVTIKAYEDVISKRDEYIKGLEIMIVKHNAFVILVSKPFEIVLKLVKKIFIK